MPQLYTEYRNGKPFGLHDRHIHGMGMDVPMLL